MLCFGIFKKYVHSKSTKIISPRKVLENIFNYVNTKMVDVLLINTLLLISTIIGKYFLIFIIIYI